jgi:hypothetical protein
MATNSPKPDGIDRAVSHAVVSVGAGLLGLRLAGPLGFVAGAVLGLVAHEALDAPLAQAVADLRNSR